MERDLDLIGLSHVKTDIYIKILIYRLECNPVCSDCQQVVDILAQIDEITAKLEACKYLF